jgi:hypothetical protein
MAADPDWQAVLARILTASTGDLRELAEMAGGDPRSFYVGTSLDGADLRGQDLRGMILPGLDLGRVQHDVETRVDDEPDEGSEFRYAPLIYVSEQDVDRASIEQLLNFTPAIVGAADRAYFLDLAMTHEGPILILAWDEVSREARYAAEELAARGLPYVVILIERFSSKRRDERPRWHRELGPVVVVPSDWSLTTGGLCKLASVGLDAIGVISELWGERDRWGGRYETLFFRARGVGLDRRLDAAAQIFDRVYASGVTPYRTTIVAPFLKPRQALGADLVAQRLLASDDILAVPFGWARPRFDLAVLGDFRPAPGPFGYIDAIHRAEPRLVALNLYRPTLPDHESRRIPITDEAGAARVAPDDLPEGRELDLGEAQRAVVSPEASLERMILQLPHGEVWLSARDVLPLDPEVPSLWLALAGHLRRMSRVRRHEAVQSLLEMLVRTAMRERQARLANPDALIQALQEPDFVRRHELSLTHVVTRNGGVIARLTIRPLRRSRPWSGASVQRYRLVISEGGPVLEDHRG